jgi:SAM-dependent methyltransferase
MSKEVWTSASSWGVTGAAYERFSEHFDDALSHCVQRLIPKLNESILDVATGTGWTARKLAERGANATGIDYSEELIIAAREIAKKRELNITFDVGDAHQLPYPDERFDSVVSTFGVIFVKQPEIVASELARVCRPGGRLALTVWAKDCVLADLGREVFSVYRPPSSAPPSPSPYAWGNESRLNELFGSDFDLKVEKGCTVLREPDGETVWNLWEKTHGLTATSLTALDAETKIAFKQAFIEFHERYRTDFGISMARDYLVVIGTRR